jgi:ABC-2 type transport system ATP-binding protein
MVTQLHLALVMAIDAKLLVLDEPTLGLDILFRKAFYDTLLNDYFDGDRTLVVSTHQVEEIQHILTDVVFLNHGKVVLASPMEDLERRFAEVAVKPESLAEAKALRPIYERQVFDRGYLIFDGVARDRLAALGEVRTPSLADIFIATMGPQALDTETAQ